jgi:ankyrin repeat protein
VDIPALIDKLVEISDGDIGYSSHVSGTAFFPLDTEGGQVFTGLLHQKPLARSDTMRLLVKQGAAALPHLIAHLDDARKTHIKIERMFSGTLSFCEEFDHNKWTESPLVVKKGEKSEPAKQGWSHTVTVADLCFVTIGQIVNRRYDAVRYQPSMCLVINSPIRSPVLRDWVKQSWGSLTPEQHRAALIADFLKPGCWDERRIGACKRLAFYYPEELEPLILKFLARPSYSSQGVWTFVRKELYTEPDPKRCQASFDAYLVRHGEAARDGILLRLFQDLRELEDHEQKRILSPLTDFADQPRKLLIQLYGKPKDIKSEDQPCIETPSDTEKARLIDEGLLYDFSEKIDRAVRDLLLAGGDDDYLARSCVRRMIGRGYDAEIEAYCQRQLPLATSVYDDEELRAIQNRIGWTKLHVATSRNHTDGVRVLLRGKVEVDAAGRDGTTPLHLAAGAGNLEIVRLLVEAGASLDPKNDDGRTPVELAVRADHLEVVRYLAKRNCSVRDVLVAAAAGRVDLLDWLLRIDVIGRQATTRSGQTPLHLAAWTDQAQIVEALLAKEADLEARNEDWLTPLHVAALAGSAEAARQLIRCGARVNAVSGRGEEPLHLAAQNGHVKVAAVLLDAKADWDARLPRMEQTPLHVAAAAGWTEMVDLLLRRGANLESVDHFKQTALHVAAAAGKREVVDLLLRLRAAMDSIDDLQGTPLHSAATAGQTEIIDLLLKRGAAVDSLNDHKWTPLHQAAYRGEVEAAKRLLAAKAAVNARNVYGWTPLHMAAQGEQVEIVRLLLAHKADVTAQNDNRHTPLDLAREKERQEIVKILQGK